MKNDYQTPVLSNDNLLTSATQSPEGPMRSKMPPTFQFRTAPVPIQCNMKEADNMTNLHGLTPQELANWDRKTNAMVGPISFVADGSISFMQAVFPPAMVKFNPNDIASVSNEGLYFAILHEFAHLHHSHPGNQHPDSKLNEYHADDTALVTAFTQTPLSAYKSADDFHTMIVQQILCCQAGGGSHPKNTDRKDRLEKLTELILNRAKVRIGLASNKVSLKVMQNFIQEYKAPLQMEEKDFKSTQLDNNDMVDEANDGSPLYTIDTSAEITLKQSLQLSHIGWFAKVDEAKAKHPALGLSLQEGWVITPKDVQKAVKDLLPNG